MPAATACVCSNGNTTWPPPKTKLPIRKSVFVRIARCRPVAAHTPSAMNVTTSKASATMPPLRETCKSSCGVTFVRAPGRNRPTTAAPAIASGVTSGCGGARSINASTATARSDRPRSGASDARSDTIAAATTATATSSKPCSHPTLTFACGSASAKAVMRIAEGSVNPIHAPIAPPGPARSQPSSMPVCELPGPGKSCVSATHSPKAASSSQRRRSTNSR